MANFKEELAQIEAFVFDVDGVFTDGRVLLTPEGEYLREFYVRDGLAVVHTLRKGYPIAVISGGYGKQLEMRMEKLGVRHVYTSKMDKTDSLLDFAARTGVPLDKMVYMGDDVPDIAPMRMVRLGVAPSDACHDVKSVVDYVSAYAGGQGCVRDILEQVLRARGDWFEI